MNLTSTRVLYESYVALKAWRRGRMPNAAFYMYVIHAYTP